MHTTAELVHVLIREEEVVVLRILGRQTCVWGEVSIVCGLWSRNSQPSRSTEISVMILAETIFAILHNIYPSHGQSGILPTSSA